MNLPVSSLMKGKASGSEVPADHPFVRGVVQAAAEAGDPEEISNGEKD